MKDLSKLIICIITAAAGIFYAAAQETADTAAAKDNTAAVEKPTAVSNHSISMQILGLAF